MSLPTGQEHLETRWCGSTRQSGICRIGAGRRRVRPAGAAARPTAPLPPSSTGSTRRSARSSQATARRSALPAQGWSSQAFDIDAMAPAITAEAWDAHGWRTARRLCARPRQARGSRLRLAWQRDRRQRGRDSSACATASGGDRLIAVKQSKGRGRTVIWRVRKGSGGALKAVDMTVDGRSLAASARSDAKAVLKKTDGNVMALLRSVGE